MRVIRVIAMIAPIALCVMGYQTQAAVVLYCQNVEKLANARSNLELSDLAYADDESMLYAVTDDARLITFRARFANDILLGLDWQGEVMLLDAAGVPLQGSAADSEGMTAINYNDEILGNTELWISFEQLPRVCRYHLDGRLAECLQLPSLLAEATNYSSPNAALESIAILPGFGVIVAAERSMAAAGNSGGWHDIFVVPGGQQWLLQAGDSDAGLTAMESMPDGSLLLLERVYSWWRFAARSELLFYRAPLATATPQVLLSTADDSLHTGNFEGLAKHGTEHLFMVSDDNRIPFTATWLLYVSLNGSGDNAACE